MSEFTFTEAPPGAQKKQPRGVGPLGGEWLELEVGELLFWA